MNYRHHFHAGNFADLVKHAALVAALARLQAAERPLLVIDTHAGAGGYELPRQALERGEAVAAARLSADPAAPDVFASLRAAMRPAAAGGLFYPGSPWLAAEALRPQDRLVACELRPDDHAALRKRLGERAGVELLLVDGYAEAAARLEQAGEQALVLIDPPYERPDDYARLTELLAAGLRASPGGVFLVWTPLKDLETFDRLLRAMEDLAPPATLVAETRLRPLRDPMRLNGCAMLVIDRPDLEPTLRAAAEWVVGAMGEPGGEARVWGLA